MTASTTPKISVLVPCYNVAHFVAECLMSLKVQTLNDIEVICLNDGSTDNTLALSSAKRLPMIRVSGLWTSPTAATAPR